MISKCNIKELDVLNSGVFLRYHAGKPISNDVTFIGLENLSISLRPFFVPPSGNGRYWDWDGNIGTFYLTAWRTLKVLKIFRAPISGVMVEPFQTFPPSYTLPKLEELYLIGNVVSSLKVFKIAPNLVKLVIDTEAFSHRKLISDVMNDSPNIYKAHLKYKQDTYDFVSMTLWRCGDVCCNTLKYFEISFEFSVTSLKILAKWTPMLKILKTILNNANIAIVCENWPNLVELTCMYGSKLTHQAFHNKRGFSFGQCIRNLTRKQQCYKFWLVVFAKVFKIF